MKQKIWISIEAAEGIAAATDWWQHNRTAAPFLFEDELSGALDLLSTNPEIGTRVKRRGFLGLRRVLLPETKYHVYYTYIADQNVVAVISLWSALRGRGPRLRKPDQTF